MELYLIRHAQSQNNARPVEERVEDAPLTDLGHEQAQMLADWIPQLQLTRLICSPFLRTLQTTRYLSRATGLAPEVRTELHELGGCVSGHTPDSMVGRPGMTRSEIREMFPHYEVERAINGDGWWKSQPYETFDDAKLRAEKLLVRTRMEFASTEERVAYVMHADFKQLFLATFHDDDLDTAINTSVSKIQIGPEETRLEFYNSVEHLSSENVTL